ncbi:hypothetical protein [Commensalibacter oyaizuii]|uniref:Uncharacterized protein n=1 Tax=Commensalibacter oyaizuii TaxID=3043873 RepID=A0ABT6Q317_9PROT|nr:hypothetical protein [Commensalibacter sp. TBRC 16381]MDI2091501.1 hypothetical protein [Commensalibacter sp. TBRC 16381]
MKFCKFSLWVFGVSLCVTPIHSVFAQEQWTNHLTATSSQEKATYHATPPLKPAKRKSKNPLRHSGWHTHPDPYIEEGGVYTKRPHPALTQHQKTLDHYGNGTPNSHTPPPSAVLNQSRSTFQQHVKITDPTKMSYIPPIPIPSDK